MTQSRAAWQRSGTQGSFTAPCITHSAGLVMVMSVSTEETTGLVEPPESRQNKSVRSVVVERIYEAGSPRLCLHLSFAPRELDINQRLASSTRSLNL